MAGRVWKEARGVLTGRQAGDRSHVGRILRTSNLCSSSSFFCNEDQKCWVQSTPNVGILVQKSSPKRGCTGSSLTEGSNGRMSPRVYMWSSRCRYGATEAALLAEGPLSRARARCYRQRRKEDRTSLSRSAVEVRPVAGPAAMSLCRYSVVEFQATQVT